MGPGAAGSAVLAALRDAGWPVAGVLGRSRASTASAARRLRVPALDADALSQAPLVVLAVRDADIRSVAASLARSGDWRGRVALHLAGARAADELEPLRRAGAAVASFHPLMTFASREPATLPRDTPFFAEGDEAAVRAARALARALGAPCLLLPPEAKALYHAAATVAGNLAIALLFGGASILAAAGIPRGARWLAPLARESVRNAGALGPERALTGPVARGDAETVERHLRALAAAGLSPSVRSAHVAGSLLALELAREGRRAPEEELRRVEGALREAARELSRAARYTGAARRTKRAAGRRRA